MSEDRVYTISIGTKIFNSVGAVFFFVVSIVFFSIGEGKAGIAIFLFPISMLTISILIVINIVKKRVIISDEGVTNISVFANKTLLFSDIKGYRIGQKYIALESGSDNNKKVLIGNYTDLGDSEQLAEWVKENFKDQDAIDLKQQEEQYLHDDNNGYSEEDRKRKLKIAKQVALAYNVIGFAGVFGLLFLVGLVPAIIMGLTYPLLGIAIMKFSNGLIKFISNSKRSVIPYLFIGFMGSALIPLFSSFDDYQIFIYHNLWLPAIAIIIVVFALLYFIGLNRTIEGIKGQVFFMAVMAVMYGFGAAVSLNCAFDNSTPKIYVARVLSERIESGKHTSYLFTLSEWGPMHEEKEEDVGKWIYNNVAVGDSVNIYFRLGKLNAPWYKVHSFAYKGK